MPKQTSNIFPDLEESDLYEIEVTGKCGSRIVKISTRNDLLPKIENTYSCRSKTMKLEVKRSFGLDIEWFKNGVSLGKTGKVLTIENYDTTKDNGVYSAQLSYKKIPELGDCINRKIEKDLTNFKEGGNLGDDGKKTYTIDEAKKVGEVDLFTLLKGNDIKTGVWFSKNIELETNLAGSYLNLKELKPGIYEFEFSTGRCLADKKAKVVITIKGKEIILKPDEDTYVIGEPKVVKVLANDPKTVDPTTVLLFPNFNLVDYEKIIMSDDFETLIIIGEGTWIAGVNGEVTFIPEPTFEGDPTPVDYIAKGYDNFGYGEPVSITLKTTPPEPKIKLNKTAPATPVSLGDEITYTFTVENVGDVELTNVTVDDPKLGGAVTLKKTTLAPEEVTTGEAKYTVTKADLNAGKVENTATAVGTDPKGGTVTDTSDSSAPEKGNKDNSPSDPTVVPVVKEKVTRYETTDGTKLQDPTKGKEFTMLADAPEELEKEGVKYYKDSEKDDNEEHVIIYVKEKTTKWVDEEGNPLKDELKSKDFSDDNPDTIEKDGVIYYKKETKPDKDGVRIYVYKKALQQKHKP